jgi:alkanesulfonate monooxygenase SsuD/methylene tetrahydromethanopterin reductase-like flavin-dependent oxidoreductase (luciferase family)
MADRSLSFGIQTPPFHPWERMVADWQRFEGLGWDSLWLPDHFLPTFRRELPFYEAWTLMAALAPLTSRARIGVLVSCNTFRHPSLLAKQAVTVDHVSNGRLEVGLGTGWVEFEHTMFGIEYPDGPDRVSRFGEAVQILDLLLRNEVVSFRGKHYRLDEAVFHPAPLQQPRPPLTLAAHGPKMLRLIAPYVDRWNSMGSPAEMGERGRRLDEALLAVDRSPDEVVKSVLYVPSITPDEHPWDSIEAFVDFVDRYRAEGISDFIFQPPFEDSAGIVERVSAEVLPGLKGEARYTSTQDRA